MTERVRIVLVDDHSIVRRGLVSFLEAFDDLEVIGDVASGEALMEQLEQWLPDVVVMDLHMPGGMDGIEAIRQVRALAPHTRIVVLTSYANDARVVAALRAGAIGYVRKEADPEILLEAMRAAAHGQSLLDPEIARAILGELAQDGKQSSRLTQRELEVLHQLALGHTNQEIAEVLVVSDETVKRHVGNILTKLQLAHRTQAVIYALKSGLISLDDIDFPGQQ
jgi:two-component system, NarL family, response regulator LiaR